MNFIQKTNGNLKSKVKKLGQNFAKFTGHNIIKSSKYDLLVDLDFFTIWERWSQIDVDHNLFDEIIKSFQNSNSQLQQDLWVLHTYEKMYQTRCNGFFVEFGAGDGRFLSNTYLLETMYDWNGILVEPSKQFSEQIRKNRTASIDSRCVFSSSKETVNFIEVDVGEFSGIQSHHNLQKDSEYYRNFRTYEVETICLNDLLLEYNAPKKINYLSIDTEGSEFEILRNFPFADWEIEIITIEHNFSENEKLLDELMKKNGYLRKLPKTSYWDAWYVLQV